MKFHYVSNTNIILPVIFLFYSVYKSVLIDWNRVPDLLKLENVPLDCEAVVNGSENGKLLDKARKWNHHFKYVESEIFNSKNICQVIHKYYTFQNKSLSIEEHDFPLAYGVVAYKDIVQVLLELSLFYQPQHLFCINIDQTSSENFKKAMLNLHDCFPNINVYVGVESAWGSYGILENVYSCFHYLTRYNHPWRYYQYLSGSDLPMRTNLEMVRIFKAMNESINSDIDEIESDRKRKMIYPPIPMYKSSMSVAVPRIAANYMIKSKRVDKLLKYLSRTWVSDESFWSSASGSPAILPVPGAVRAKDIIWFRKNFKLPEPSKYTVDHVGTSYIGRYQLWIWHKKCEGRMKHWSCVYGVGDIEEIVTRPELVAHKFYINFEPAAMICLAKEIRRRSADPRNKLFNARSYSEMPTVEMSNGKGIMQLTHPDWLTPNSFYNPDIHPVDNSKFV